MRYYLLVSHGTFAPGLHNAVGMMAGADRNDIRSTSLRDDMDVPTYRNAFTEMVSDITEEDEILLFGDIIGGSPLTNAMDVLSERELLANTIAIGGMNMPLVLTALFSDEDMTLEETAEEIMVEAVGQIKRFDLGGSDEDDI